MTAHAVRQAAISPLAGRPLPAALRVDVDALLAAYHVLQPDAARPAERVAFGTSGHRGSSLRRSFNEWHVLAISQAICDYRLLKGVGGPLFLGVDTHALSAPAAATVLEVVAANGNDIFLAQDDEFTPTPVISHAIITHNRGRRSAFLRADGIIVTPSHNPPDSGGIKYNLAHGGPAGSEVTAWIDERANGYLQARLAGVRRITRRQAERAGRIYRGDFLNDYVNDLDSVLDLTAVHDAALRIGVDPLGGAGVHYWPAIAARYRLDLTVINPLVDRQFGFVCADRDGQVRMDPSSAFAMQPLIAHKDDFDITLACDTDHDRHGIVTPAAGLLPTDHYLPVAIDYLFHHRPGWDARLGIAKNVVCTQMIDRVAARLGRRLVEVPVGFKWFVEELFGGNLGVAAEESAGASIARRDGRVWTTDKDGIVAALLAAEIRARSGRDPGELYTDLSVEFGECFNMRIDVPADAAQRQRLAGLTAAQCRGDRHADELAGEPILDVIDRAPGNGAPIGGIKVVAEHGWFAVRPSGTEDLCKIYVESRRSQEHLDCIAGQAQSLVNRLLASGDSEPAERGARQAAGSATA
jgi:phosphoglucomutase